MRIPLCILVTGCAAASTVPPSPAPSVEWLGAHWEGNILRSVVFTSASCTRAPNEIRQVVQWKGPDTVLVHLIPEPPVATDCGRDGRGWLRAAVDLPDSALVAVLVAQTPRGATKRFTMVPRTSEVIVAWGGFARVSAQTAECVSFAATAASEGLGGPVIERRLAPAVDLGDVVFLSGYVMEDVTACGGRFHVVELSRW